MKLFMNLFIKFNNIFLYVSFACLFFLILFKSIYTPIGYDEAYTYLNYIKTNKIFSTGVANNHFLATLFSYLFSLISNQLLSLRLPNIFFAGGYFFIASCIAYKSKFPLLIFSILVASPYMLEFFSLFRGYGLACFFIIVSMYIFYFREKNNFTFLKTIILLSFATYAFYPIIIILFTFILLHSINEYKNNEDNILFALKFCSLLVVYPVYALYSATLPGSPLTGYEGELLAFIKGYLGFLFLLGPYDTSFSRYLYLLLLIPLFFPIYLSKRSKKIILLFSISLLIYFLVTYLAKKPMPYGRIMVPFLCLFLIAICSIWIDILNSKISNYFIPIGCILSILIIVNIFINYKFNIAYDYFSTWQTENDVISMYKKNDCLNKNEINPIRIFYLESNLINIKYCSK